MIKIEHTVTPSGEQWAAVIRGMRNPMNSWSKSDSMIKEDGSILIGEADLKLMTSLRKEGSPSKKYLRMLPVYADITAPLRWWKEYATYKVGTVENSCSTMHKIQDHVFTRRDFSVEHIVNEADNFNWLAHLDLTIAGLNIAREKYLETKDKKYWWQMIDTLPDSYLQKRTIFTNYAVLENQYMWRHAHKQDEWRLFCDWASKLPYGDILIR